MGEIDRRTPVALALCLGACVAAAAPAKAAEYALGEYLLGYSIPLSGFTPPPGIYYSDTFYLYSGSASGNLKIPFGQVVAAGLKYQFVVNVSQVAWVTDLKALGGSIGFAALIPFGSDRNTVGAEFVGPLGVYRNPSLSQEVFGMGDSAYSTFIGWDAGDHHWNFTLTGFAPTGNY